MARPKKKRRFRKWRRKWRKKGTNYALRWFLRSKAALGRWDKRYCDYYDVDAHVTPAVKRFFTRAYARGMVPTSSRRYPVTTTGSYHTRRDAKGRGKAGDVGRRRHVSLAKGSKKQARFQRREFKKWKRGKRKNMVELIGPDNYHTILRGQHTPLGEGTALETQHDNHVHAAFD